MTAENTESKASRTGKKHRRYLTMAKIYYQNDAYLSLLQGKTIAIIGYGSQ